MSVNNMSQIIKNVLEVTDTVLERPATRNEVIKVLELIESFKMGKTIDNALPMPTPQPVDVVKVERKKPMRPATSIRWKQHKEWLDAILDGQPHIIPYSNLELVIPFKKFGNDNMRTRLYREAVKRGYKTATISFDNKSKSLFVQAVAK